MSLERHGCNLKLDWLAEMHSREAVIQFFFRGCSAYFF